MSLDPKKVVATFDSASELHAALVAALNHQPFPHLGNSELYAGAIRAAGHLPWPILRSLYTRIGGAEGINPDTLPEVDMDSVANSFAEPFAAETYPAVVVGASNGAIMHLAAAMGAPWLPGTVLIPVHHVGDGDRPNRALEFGKEFGPRFLDANPHVRLHQMHDMAQDALMTTRMAYFRTKYTQLPPAYREFLDTRLAPGAPVFLVDDRSTWPVTEAGPRHVFQTGGRGGLTPEEHLARPHTPAATTVAPEAEWGADPDFTDAVAQWCATHDHPLIRVVLPGPQEASAPVADTIREWTIARGGAADKLLVSSFVIADPWRTFATGRVPFWTYFPVREALNSLDAYLADGRYEQASVTMFQHGVESPGLATPADFEQVLRTHNTDFHLVAVDPDKSPHDIGSMTRYGPELQAEPDAGLPWEPLSAKAAASGIAALTDNRDGHIGRS
ncbi:hypothetical protein [Herbiconiux sp. VKM Ac-2851]|uniref:hypothetical protein n=1 Tax=Herbiconiux sp. VKM Ac-2851 TaxID=2739025 RepID=UPI001563A367|nr:hypothetical protein [Herbiconiux sp. VKM Ac-2851]NQX37064.1 hypothetical protein [Herbiconiux sp. VKM Ac-2851]